MSVGASKFYRTSCFREIGGFVREVMWDGIDCHRCRMLGWIAQSADDEALRFVHLRPMASSQQGILAGRKREGYGLFLWLLLLILVSGFAVEGLRIVATKDPWGPWSPFEEHPSPTTTASSAAAIRMFMVGPLPGSGRMVADGRPGSGPVVPLARCLRRGNHGRALGTAMASR